MMVHTLWPLAPDRTVNICEWHFHPRELARPGFEAADVIEFWDLTNRQDWHVCELSQAGISSRAYVPGPYSNREDLLYAFDRMIVALHDGERRSRARRPEPAASARRCRGLSRRVEEGRLARQSRQRGDGPLRP